MLEFYNNFFFFFFRIGFDRFDFLADKIVELFPTEAKVRLSNLSGIFFSLYAKAIQV